MMHNKKYEIEDAPMKGPQKQRRSTKMAQVSPKNMDFAGGGLSHKFPCEDVGPAPASLTPIDTPQYPKRGVPSTPSLASRASPDPAARLVFKAPNGAPKAPSPSAPDVRAAAAPAAAAPAAAAPAVAAPAVAAPSVACPTAANGTTLVDGTACDDESTLHTLPSGEVGRRAPMNPLHSPVLAKFGIGKNRKRRRKVKDPKLLNNPLRGRLVVCISTTALLLWLFFWEILYNYTSFNGRCVSLVQYPDYTEPDEQKRAPMVIRYGYGACEYNLGPLAYPRVGLGNSATDKGWPTNLVKNGAAGAQSAGWDSPNGRILSVFGGLETNFMRNYGEPWRVFSSMYLHGGFLHIGINLLCQIQSLWMLEPDWGFWRTALLFFVGGVTGNLVSAVADPCNITVGSSGAMYSLMGALIPYCVEYWKTIPRPCCILIFFIVVLLIGILTGMSGFTDNYAHIGGCVGGILFGFATITTVAACDKCTLGERMATTKPFSYCVPKKTQERLMEIARNRKEEATKRRRLEAVKKKKAGGARGRAIRVVKMKVEEQGRPPCKMAFREWLVRIICAACLIAIWIGLFIALMNESAYKNFEPPGQLKFQGWLYCKCGEIKYVARQTTWNLGMFWCFGNEQDADFYLKA